MKVLFVSLDVAGGFNEDTVVGAKQKSRFNPKFNVTFPSTFHHENESGDAFRKAWQNPSNLTASLSSMRWAACCEHTIKDPDASVFEGFQRDLITTQKQQQAPTCSNGARDDHSDASGGLILHNICTLTVLLLKT
jgi:hypothetical protein